MESMVKSRCLTRCLPSANPRHFRLRIDAGRRFGHLQATRMDDCLFCKIIDGQINADIVYEDERAVAFRDINPQAPTHVLVIPRSHIATINDLEESDEADLGHLFVVAKKVAEQEGLAERGYRTVINCNADAGQSVFHIHAHLLGGKPMGWPPFPGAPRSTA